MFSAIIIIPWYILYSIALFDLSEDFSTRLFWFRPRFEIESLGCLCSQCVSQYSCIKRFIEPIRYNGVELFKIYNQSKIWNKCEKYKPYHNGIKVFKSNIEINNILFLVFLQIAELLFTMMECSPVLKLNQIIDVKSYTLQLWL